MNAETKKQTAPPYVPYSTFTNFINGLRKTGVPSHIDRSIMINISGSGQSAMLSALRSLELINSESEPCTNLEKLVSGHESDFTTTMAGLVKNTYSFLFDDSINIENTTSKKVEDKFRLLGVQGSTLTKCISFFLSAAKAADIKVSAHVSAPKLQRSSTPKKNKPNGVNQNDPNNPPAPPILKPTPSGTEKIAFSLRNMPDVIVYFPDNLESDDDIRRVIDATVYNLELYYGLKHGRSNQ